MLGGPHVGFSGGAGGGGGSTWGQASTAHFHGSGAPTGIVTPTGIGDLYVDDTTPALYQAYGTTPTTWERIGAPPPTIKIRSWRAEFFGHTTLTTTPPIPTYTPQKGTVLFSGQFHLDYTSGAATGFSQSGTSLYGTCKAGGFPYYGSSWVATAHTEALATVLVMNATCTEFMQVSCPLQTFPALGTHHFPMTTLDFSHGTDLVHTHRGPTTWAIKSTAGGLYAVYVQLSITKMSTP